MKSVQSDPRPTRAPHDVAAHSELSGASTNRRISAKRVPTAGTKRIHLPWLKRLMPHQPPAYNPTKYIAYTVSTEGCFTQDMTKASITEPPPPAGQGTLKDVNGLISNLYYGAITAVDVRTGKVIAKVNTDEEIRSGMLATAGGLVFTALTNGDFVALND